MPANSVSEYASEPTPETKKKDVVWFALNESRPLFAFAVIWTTTAWTIPANQALNLNPELDYALVDTDRGLLILAASLVEMCMNRYALDGKVLATVKGEKLGGLEFEHPLYDVDAT